jgi:endo-1,3(4)-beta-glucanase
LLFPADSAQAKGLFDSADGKDQESSSEDGFASYAIKMWGRVCGNPRLEASGDLRIAIQTRVFSNYFLLESNNTHQPSNFIGNKVTGILFENKIDHATYFGGNIEYVHGIHMIPLSPATAVFRRPKFSKFSPVLEFGGYFNVP